MDEENEFEDKVDHSLMQDEDLDLHEAGSVDLEDPFEMGFHEAEEPDSDF